MKQPRIAFVFGTRPEIIKLSPVIRECQRVGLSFLLIHSNQHYSTEMDSIFFKQLQLPQPQYMLKVGSGSHAWMTARILERLEPVLEKEKCDWVVVQGDTNTVLAGALAASKLGILVAHIEAGLRSYDKTMPEEINRVVVDHIADLLFCPTPNQRDILKKEGISEEKIRITGNTVVEAVHQNLGLTEQVPEVSKEPYFVLTLHRPSNVDLPKRLSKLLKNVNQVAKRQQRHVFFTVHPRTKQRIEALSFSDKDIQSVRFLPPLGYLEMLKLLSQSEVILTDSGGIQEEACILQVPCITLRNNTERPETIEVGANRLCSGNLKDLENAIRTAVSRPTTWENPFGDDTVSSRILENIVHFSSMK